MTAFRIVVSRVLSLFGRRRRDVELSDEIQAHLDLLADEHVRRGMSASDARAAARREFGGVEQMKETYRDRRGLIFVDELAQDVRYAVRLLRRNPVFALTAALSLAIGIGATTTVFTVANALLFHPPTGVVEPDRLVDVGSSRTQNGFGPSSYPNYLDLRRRTTTLEGVYASNLLPRAMGLGPTRNNSTAAERVFGTFITVNYFNVLGARPAVGRLFDANDSEEPGAAPVAVLSYGFWTRRFHKESSVVGRAVALNGHPFTIVGVAAEGFQGTGVRAGDVWVPMSMMATATSQGAAVLMNRAAVWLLVGGRLKTGVTLAQAAAEADAIGRTLEREYPDENRDTRLRVAASSPVPGNSGLIAAFLVLLMALVSLVLVIACANLAGVLLARAAARRLEIAVRLALGAGRARLVRQLLVETLLLFVIGGATGLVLARGLTSLLVPRLPALPFPVDVSLALDGRAIVFTTGLVLVAALFSGLAPALQASKADVAPALKDDAQAPGRVQLRHVFVTGQVALSILLVIIAGLFVRALERAGSMDPGFDPHGVELASLDLSQAGYTGTTGPRFARALVDRVRALPDVQAASMALVLPGGFETQRRGVIVPGLTPPNGQRTFGVDWNVVEPGYFATLRIPMSAGRDFTAEDRGGAEPVAIVGEGTARQFWPGQDAVGQYLLQPTFGPRGPTDPTLTLRVIGVARDVKASSLIDGLARSLVYVPLQQQYTPIITIVARARRGQPITDELRAVVGAMDRNLPIVTSQTLEESVALGQVPQRVVASVAGNLGLVGLLLAAIGIYGVTAYAVTRRTREIGIRIAMGARGADVVGMVLRQGMALTAVGTAIGLVLAAAAGRLLSAFLFGISPIDPIVFGGAETLFAAVGLAACYVPARRASRVDPMVALRYE